LTGRAVNMPNCLKINLTLSSIVASQEVLPYQAVKKLEGTHDDQKQ
jgi:hypothetical protein